MAGGRLRRSPAALQCDDVKTQKCDAKGLSWLAGADCAKDNKNCVKGLCVDFVCKAATKACQAGKLATCAGDGMSWSLATCGVDTACEAGACEAVVCEAKAKSCDGFQAQVCNASGTKVQLISDCAKANKACLGGDCVPLMCKPGTEKCQAGKHMVCTASGLGWAPSPCDKGDICLDGECVAVVCEADKKFCEGQQVRTCNATGTASSVSVDCAKTKQACLEGACSDLLCQPDATDCKAGKLQVCNKDGLGWSEQSCGVDKTCVGTSCKAVICEANKTKCAGDKAETCDGTGTAVVKTVDCAVDKKICSDGACVALLCKPGVETCKDGKKAFCAFNGLSWVLLDCGVGKVCVESQCLPVICVADKATCKVREVHKCNATGTASGLLSDCAKTNQTCIDGLCKPMLCVPASTQCDKVQLATCNADGLTWTKASCGADKVCELGKCAPVICQPGVVGCAGFDAAKCNALGTKNLVVEACSKAGKVCQAGKCVPAVCKPGDKECSGKDVKTCTADALGWQVSKCETGNICDAGVCAKVICAAGKAYCDAAAKTVQVCNALGTKESTKTTCKTDEACDKGVCLKKICAPKALECKDVHTLNYCNESGTAWKGFACGADKVCYQGDCAFKVCEPDTKYCKGSVATSCTITGLVEISGADCSKTGKVCWQGDCVDKICQPGSDSCIDNQVATCKSDGLGWDKKACDDGNACTSNGCKDGKCDFGPTKGCDDSNVCTADACDTQTGKCNNTPVSGGCDDGTKCTSDEFCQGGVCKAGLWGTVSTLAGTGVKGSADGPVDKATFSEPYGLAVGADGVIWLADLSNHRIRQIKGGSVTTRAGSSKGYADDKGDAAKFASPVALAVDAVGAAWISDQGNHRIRHVAPDGTVTTLAGSSTHGHLDGTGAAARFYNPTGVAFGPAGNLFVADQSNNRIRKVSPTGQVSTVAGSGGKGAVDGAALSATFYTPIDVAVDGSGQVFVADYNNNRIRKVSTGGTVTTIAGSSQGHLDGQGSQARFNRPFGIDVSASGSLVVADSANHRVRLINASGMVSTLAGAGAGAFADGPANQARFSSPAAARFDHWGRVVIADRAFQRIRLRRQAALHQGRLRRQDGPLLVHAHRRGTKL